MLDVWVVAADGCHCGANPGAVRGGSVAASICVGRWYGWVINGGSIYLCSILEQEVVLARLCGAMSVVLWRRIGSGYCWRRSLKFCAAGTVPFYGNCDGLFCLKVVVVLAWLTACHDLLYCGEGVRV